MRASQKGVSGANATTKASPFESEIYPSHKPSVCTLCISPCRGLPPLARRMDTAMHQFELAREDKGDHIACLEARKHFAWYLRGVAHSSYYKEKISSISTPEDVEAIAKGIRRDLQ